MKKKITILLVAFIIGFVIQNQAQNSKSFKISGKLNWLPNATKVYLITQQGDTIAKAISKGDCFGFSGILPLDGRFHFIVVDTLVSKVITQAIFVVQGAISIVGTVGQKEVVVNGSPYQLEFDDLVNSVNEIDDDISNLRASLGKVDQQMRECVGDSISTSLLSKKKLEIWGNIKKAGEIATQRKKRLVFEWIESHRKSKYAPYVIKGYATVLGEDVMQKAYNNLSAEVKASYYGFELKKELDNIFLAKNMSSGSPIPNFKLTSSDKKVFLVLESVKAKKLTLIDFWASWCSPCRAEIPNMKKVYDAFRDKGFNIIGVSSDANEIAWKKALGEDKTPWIHGWDNLDKASKGIFSIGAIPAFALVDGDGKLIAFECGMSNIASFGPPIRGEGLYKTIEALLKEKSK